MPQFRVTYTVYEENEPNKAARFSSTMNGLKMVVEANASNIAMMQVEAMYPKNKCKAWSATKIS